MSNEKQLQFASALAYADLDTAFMALRAKGQPATLEAALAYAHANGLPLNGFGSYVENGKLKAEYQFAADWEIVSATNQNHEGGSGLYAFIIDTGETNILTCRGSEDMKEFRNVEQDWLGADLGLLNSTMTEQEESLRAFMQANADKLTDKPWMSTGHSLGGALADYAAIMSVEMGLDNYAGTINFDGPGHSKEFIEKYADAIAKVSPKMVHLKASIVGNILFDLPGVRQEHITTKDVGLIEEHYMGNWEWEDDELKRGSQSTTEYIIEKATRGADNLPKVVGDTLAKIIVIAITGVNWASEFAKDHPTLTKMIVTAICGFLLTHPSMIGVIIGAVATLVVAVVVLVVALVIGQIIYEFIEMIIAEVVEAVCKIVSYLKDKAVELYHAVVDAIKSIKEYLHSLTPGARYAASNPYIKADTAALRDYAQRLTSVNSRLVRLDKDLDSLYWQVGLMDLAEIITANLITSYSASLLLARNYLNYAADELEAAENKAKGYMGG